MTTTNDITRHITQQELDEIEIEVFQTLKAHRKAIRERGLNPDSDDDCREYRRQNQISIIQAVQRIRNSVKTVSPDDFKDCTTEQALKDWTRLAKAINDSADFMEQQFRAIEIRHQMNLIEIAKARRTK